MSANLPLGRSRPLHHPSGLNFTTPLLVPSFSSKGFPVTRQNGKTWVARTLETTSEWLTERMLISAYDIFHEQIPTPKRLISIPELTFIDSGGYEASYDEDLSAVTTKDHRPRAWSANNLKKVLDAWPERFAAVFVSYDHPARRIPLTQQLKEARKLFSRYPNQLHSFLLKPEKKSKKEKHQYLDSVLSKVTAEPHLLTGFQMIGVTEKELGSSLLERMQRIAELRLALDGAGLSAPIQVFGALDPISTCLYFLAGAEVFDGLTWLRYAYHNGMCVYRANYGALAVGLDHRDTLVDAKTMADNLNQLRTLELAMRRAAHDQDLHHFPCHNELLRRSFDDLRVKLDRAKG